MEAVQDIDYQKFVWYDYIFFFLTVLVSVLIGIYYGLYRKQQSAEDYLFGGKKMMFLPISMSLIANNISGIVLLAIPSDVYRYGISYWFTYISIVLILFASYWIVIPVFQKLNITSIFEYLELRFDGNVRLLASSMYVITMILMQPIFIYIPSLTLAETTGINVHSIYVIICLICTFYAGFGGFKAVVYADTFQVIVIFTSLVTIFILGIYKCGGLENVWTTSSENNRLLLTFEFDFTKRNTFWAATVGIFILWSSFVGINQVYIQKYMSLTSRSDIMTALILSAIGIFTIGSLANFLGLIIYTEYSDCDPFEAGILQKLDQLVPYYVIQLSKPFPGLAGLYAAGIFNASLSTLSAYLNSLSAIIYKDYIAHSILASTSERRICVILKIISFAMGIIFAILVLLIEHLGPILILVHGIIGTTGGPLLGLFVSGMFLPNVNEKGALFGALLSLLVTGSVWIGSLWYQMSGFMINPPLPVSTEGCSHLNRSSNTETLMVHDSYANVPYIFKISIYWYSTIGLTVSLIAGILFSLFAKSKKTVNEDLFTPIIRPLLSSKYHSSSLINN